jgi:integrase
MNQTLRQTDIDLYRFLATNRETFQKRCETLAPSTLQNYERLYNAMTRDHQTPLERAGTLGSYSTFKAAWQFGHTREAIKLAERASEIYRLAKFTSSTSKEDLPALELVLCEGHKHLDALSLANSEPDRAVLSKKKKRSAGSVKHRIPRLKTGWRDEVLQHAINHNCKYALAIAVMSLSGARPAELETGVTCIVDDLGIRFVIQGAKTHNGAYGHKMRTFTCCDDDLAARYLRTAGKSKRFVVKAPAKRLVDTIPKIARKLYPRRNAVRPTAYCFRNAMSADLKALGFSKETIAGILGHCVTETQRYYSTAKSPSSSRKITNVVTSGEVRTSPERDYSRFTSSADDDIPTDR